MPTISIIVPVYKVEKYLDRCIESILSQTYTDFELILVDDGSPDNCPSICDDWAGKDSRVRVVHKENGGVSRARNTALDIVKGEFVTFCDSDDFWAPDWLEWLISEMNYHQTDMVIGNFRQVNDNAESNLYQSKHPTGLTIFDTKENRVRYLIQDFLCGKYGWEVWTRLFRMDIIRDHSVRFCTTCSNFAEDLAFVLEYMLYVKSVYSGEYCGYRYYVRDGSMMQSSISKVKLNELNEVSYWFMPKYLAVFTESSFSKLYPIFHFLLLTNQYPKALRQHLPSEIRKIEKYEWYRKQTKRIFRCYKALKFYLGEVTAKRILLLSNYCLHQHWRQHQIESAILYKWVLKGKL